MVFLYGGVRGKNHESQAQMHPGWSPGKHFAVPAKEQGRQREFLSANIATTQIMNSTNGHDDNL